MATEATYLFRVDESGHRVNENEANNTRVLIGEASAFSDHLTLNSYFLAQYQYGVVPNVTANLLNDLLTEVQLTSLRNQYLALLCMMQYAYDNVHYEDTPLMQDFENDYSAWIEFFEVVDRYYEKDDDLHSLFFKFNSAPYSIPIKNFFVVDEIYKAIFIGFGITKENYKEKKEEFLLKSNRHVRSKPSEQVKQELVTGLFNFIESSSLKGNSKYSKQQFIGCLFILANIPTTNGQPIVKYKSLEGVKQAVNLENFKHYFDRPKKFLNNNPTNEANR